MVPSVSALEVVDCIGMLFDNFTCQVCAVCSFQVYFALFSNLEIMQGGPPRAVSAGRVAFLKLFHVFCIMGKCVFN